MRIRDWSSDVCSSDLDLAGTARDILAKADAAGCEVVLPSDAAIAAELKEGAETTTVPIAAVPPDKMILDVGPETAAALGARPGDCRTLPWNGPLGPFEVPPFPFGHIAVADRKNG